METKRVGIFIRVSTDMQVQDESPEHHEQRARWYISSKDGWQVVEVYRLDAVSGKSVMQQPETKRMLADIRSGHITGLVFSKLARLARNTKELLEFAEIFRACNADLISLSESIDTSTPAGRLFYTMIAAMAQWEREEIASRVAASVPIRARMGKPLGGQASFGYRWQGNELVIDEAEAPIRKLMYELFVRHQRKLTTAKALNDAGYRTRNGSIFTRQTVMRLLRDSAAKGERRANYTKSRGDGKAWSIKPQSEWIILPCPAIVSRELWDECNAILDMQEGLQKPKGPKAVYLLSGYVHCVCGNTMYVYHNSKTYVCKKCKNRITVADLDEIYQSYLRDYLSGINHATYVEATDQELQEKKTLLEALKKDRARLSRQADDMLAMRLNGEMTKELFAEKFKPVEERILQMDARRPELEAEIDVRTIQMMSSEIVVSEIRTLYDQWAQLPFEQKRGIVETITKAIEIDREDITITLAYAPSIPLNAENSVRSNKDSYSPPT
ncbi:recombinase family protein [Mucilaginibacter ginsenosidivorax]|uniref:Recombinase family protein n=1 Tax=Mucilaginibacter ginsenosidivorax TaxID=862126 RepID=A0A5B8W129_9SPHI|nr:recombinase family protein [Mucilaginibacter ginsenosidivorax]QEC77381.1 recombinase family protein [Mucilaginibacter ginsenosidivorax]